MADFSAEAGLIIIEITVPAGFGLAFSIFYTSLLKIEAEHRLFPIYIKSGHYCISYGHKVVGIAEYGYFAGKAALYNNGHGIRMYFYLPYLIPPYKNRLFGLRQQACSRSGGLAGEKAYNHQHQVD